MLKGKVDLNNVLKGSGGNCFSADLEPPRQRFLRVRGHLLILPSAFCLIKAVRSIEKAGLRASLSLACHKEPMCPEDIHTRSDFKGLFFFSGKMLSLFWAVGYLQRGGAVCGCTGCRSQQRHPTRSSLLPLRRTAEATPSGVNRWTPRSQGKGMQQACSMGTMAMTRAEATSKHLCQQRFRAQHPVLLWRQGFVSGR